jgi:hypothetical protein
MMGLSSFVQLINSFSWLSYPRYQSITKTWQDFGKQRHWFLTLLSQSHPIMLDDRQIGRIVSEAGRQFASIRGDCFRLTAYGKGETNGRHKGVTQAKASGSRHCSVIFVA